MFVELVLDDYNEDPVNLIRVRCTGRNVGATDEDPGRDVYEVTHEVEARGSADVRQKFTIEVDSQYLG